MKLSSALFYLLVFGAFLYWFTGDYGLLQALGL